MFTNGDGWIPPEESKAFGKRLRDTREARKMSQWDAARKVGVSPNTWLSWEKGYSRPNPSRISKIASALEVTEAFLRTGADTIKTEVPEDDASESLASDVEKLRQKIALAMGMLPSKVRLSVEFLSG